MDPQDLNMKRIRLSRLRNEKKEKLPKVYFSLISFGFLFGAIVLLWLVNFSREAEFEGRGISPQTSERNSRTVTLSYSFELKDLPGHSYKIYSWVPLPPTNQHQKLESFHISADLPYTILTEPEYGNQFIHIDLSERNLSKNGKLSVTIAFTVTRWASYFEDLLTDRGKLAKTLNFQRFLAPDRLVPVDGKIAKEARQVVGNISSPLKQAELLYNHTVQSMSYDKTGLGWGKGDAIYACEVRKGNCTDFHSLFIGEARSLGIPARFIMGLPLPAGKPEGVISGYHCWAEFYLEGKGWVPIDASEAKKFPERKEAYFGGLDENRVEFTIGRDIHLPGASTNPFNFVIYPYVEVNGKPYEKVETQFFFKEEKIELLKSD